MNMSEVNPEQLIEAIEQHDVQKVASLLAQGADPNRGLERHPTSLPLHVAVEEMSEGGPLESIALLLKSGARPDGDPTARHATPLLLALMHDLQPAVLMLLAANANPNFMTDEGVSPLLTVVERNDVDTAAMLLRLGATKSINDFGGPSGMNPLGRATSNLSIPMMKLLLSAGADAGALDADKRTARDRLPKRESNPQAWDEATELLG